ncbi:putative F-box domain-containing protein [Helianthus annuus]|nr:putative F-box domain-containing protein [Helianthus annuus]KAJ0830631.1 putative F-box domain-containing protein [Helianthus annuus]KAJ0844020.1 putative F-box domain-containing protein [Helianthus annuus]
MLPELLGEIIRRVEANDDRWPLRRNVVACGCVCKRWREVSREIVTGNITFPSCLKQNEAAPQRRHLKNDVKGNRFLDGYNPGTLYSRKPGIYRNAYGHHLPEMYNEETCFLQLIEPNTAGVGKISCKQIDTTIFCIALGR